MYDGGEMVLLQDTPETSLHMIMYFIVIHLYKEVLGSSRWMPGMSDQEQRLMESIQQAMRELKPARGMSIFTHHRHH